MFCVGNINITLFIVDMFHFFSLTADALLLLRMRVNWSIKKDSLAAEKYGFFLAKMEEIHASLLNENVLYSVWFELTVFYPSLSKPHNLVKIFYKLL